MFAIVILLYVYSFFQMVIGFIGGVGSDIHGAVVGDSYDPDVCDRRSRSNGHFLKWIGSLVLATFLAAEFVI